MKLYYHPMSRSVTVLWMLAELQADCELQLMDFTTGENLEPAFTAINPMAKVPTLVDEGVVVTEAAAICTYLADRFPARKMAPAPDSPERGQYYRYLFFAGTSLEPMLTVYQQPGAAEYSPQSVGWGDFERGMATAEAMTPVADWVMGRQFTTADVVFGGTLDFALQFGWITSPSQRIKAYVQRLKARPAYRETHDEAWHELP